jgi:rhamnose utilization protein RhaD (predicted bifunctional aldolase and dehydrogenase)
MVAAFDYCLHGKGGAAPSIDTAMHGLVDAAHVDHLHPDSGIAIATAVDGEALTAKIFGDKVVWVPWRRPGFQLGLDIAAIKEANPQAIGCILGGHGITAWGATSEEARSQLALDHRTGREVHQGERQGRALRRRRCPATSRCRRRAPRRPPPWHR